MSNLQLSAAAYIYIHYALKKKRKQRRWWQTQLFKSRDEHSGNVLLADLKFQAISGQYKNFTRMSPTDFEYLINLIGPKIAKQDTFMRKSITVQERLSITLRFLATGDHYSSLQYLFRVSKQAISQIIPEVCKALIEALKYNIQVILINLYLFASYFIILMFYNVKVN